MLIANIYANKHQISARLVVGNILKFPPFLAFVIGWALNLCQLNIPEDIDATLDMMGSLVVPLALLSVGMQLKLDFKSLHWNYVWLGLGFKLLLFPAIIFTLCFIVFKETGQIIEITVIESAMASMITAAIVAIEYGLKPRFLQSYVECWNTSVIFNYWTVVLANSDFLKKRFNRKAFLLEIFIRKLT
nr:AEC family transporter [Balneicella halophila]